MTEIMGEHGRVICAVDLAVKVACKPWQVVCFLEKDLVQYFHYRYTRLVRGTCSPNSCCYARDNKQLGRNQAKPKSRD